MSFLFSNSVVNRYTTQFQVVKFTLGEVFRIKMVIKINEINLFFYFNCMSAITMR